LSKQQSKIKWSHLAACSRMGCGAPVTVEGRALHEKPFDAEPTAEEIKKARAKHKSSEEREIKPAINYESHKFDHAQTHAPLDLGCLGPRPSAMKFYGETFHGERVDLRNLRPTGSFTRDFEVLAHTANHSHMLVHDDLWHYYASGAKPKELESSVLRDEVYDSQSAWRRKIKRNAHRIRNPREANPHDDPHGRDASKQLVAAPTSPKGPGSPGANGYPYPKGQTSPQGPGSPKGPSSPKGPGSPTGQTSPKGQPSPRSARKA